ncbi:uncharacterized protein MELLADRAFT_70696 [Melampsora larici-populina 98AG31]|uniref:Uncharacterized protein n=1 Tax=Melampsora larici-populina (strain 98AG31 / pathotype 3-4-7) TaxID=747676 RepID=F4R5M5_MELLP|nr:uncharacterized protein MELLADRAFT_70696 [Melampsora larici-populina 98AG31]EGG12074.1 hypothetical protein MELLADRAFT_70696 [Melampsora larici-populina 98AG31]
MSKFEYMLPQRNYLSRSTAAGKFQPLQDAPDHKVTSDVEHARKKNSLPRFGYPTLSASSQHLQPSSNSACSISNYSCQSNDSTEQLMLVRTPSLEDGFQLIEARDATNIEPESPTWEWKIQTPASVKRSLSRSKNLFRSTNSVRASVEAVSRLVQLDDEVEELSEANQPEPPKMKSSKSSSSLRKYFFESSGDSNTKTKGLKKKLSFMSHFSLKSSDSIQWQIQPYIVDNQTEELSLEQFLTNETGSTTSPVDKEPYAKKTFPDYSSSNQKEALHDPSPLPPPLKTKSRSGLFFWRRNKETEFNLLNSTPSKINLTSVQISSPSAFRHINQNEDSQYFEPSIRGSCETSYHEWTLAETNPANSILASSVSSYSSTTHTIGTNSSNSKLLPSKPSPPPRPPRLRPVMSIPFAS